jgi:hypothetical protein
MSPYPPFPVFTFIGFAIHSAVFLAIGVRFLLHSKGSRVFLLLGIASLLDTLNFITLLTLFFIFPNTIVKTQIFIFNATVTQSLVALMFILAVLYLETPLRRSLWGVFGVALVGIFYSYQSIFNIFMSTVPVEYAYVHPAYPAIITKSFVYGIMSGFFVGLFFLYHAFSSRALFVRNRGLVLGLGAGLLGISSVFWISHEPVLYISMHIIGPLGSLLVAYGVFAYAIPKSEKTP